MHRLLGPSTSALGEIASRGPSTAARQLRATLEQVGTKPRATVLIEGERGSWRTAVAAHVHALSPAGAEPIVALGAEPDFDVALPRALEAAGRGSIVLEEPAELGADAQAGLARLLERRTWTAPDGEERALEVRLLATTDTGFDEAVRAGALLEDLAYRLNALRIELAPLRERREDLAALLAGLATCEDAPRPTPHFAAEELAPLASYAWPGNLRELDAAWRRAAVLSPRGRLEVGRFLAAATPDAPAETRLAALEADWIRRVLARESGNKSRAARALGIHRATLYHKLREYEIEPG